MFDPLALFAVLCLMCTLYGCSVAWCCLESVCVCGLALCLHAWLCSIPICDSWGSVMVGLATQPLEICIPLESEFFAAVHDVCLLQLGGRHVGRALNSPKKPRNLLSV